MGIHEKVRGKITLEVSGDWPYSVESLLAWMNAKLEADLPQGWGTGRGGINYAKAKVISIESYGGD